MTYKKTCIICTPRSGSQLCEKLIQQISPNTVLLGEYFEKWNQNNYEIEQNNIKKIIHISKKTGFSIDPTYSQRLNLLRDLEQSLTIRLFYLYGYEPFKIKTIIETLHQFGFEFIILSRNNKKEQLLSWLIAKAHSDFYKDNKIFVINNVLQCKVKIYLDNYKNIVNQFIFTYRYWDKNITQLFKKINYHSIVYESIFNDLQKAYQFEFMPIGAKTINGNHLDYVENHNEVSDYLDKLLI